MALSSTHKADSLSSLVTSLDRHVPESMSGNPDSARNVAGSLANLHSSATTYIQVAAFSDLQRSSLTIARGVFGSSTDLICSSCTGNGKTNHKKEMKRHRLGNRLRSNAIGLLPFEYEARSGVASRMNRSDHLLAFRSISECPS